MGFYARTNRRANRKTARFGWQLKGKAVATIVGGKKSGRKIPNWWPREKSFRAGPPRQSFQPRTAILTMKAILALEDGSVFHGQVLARAKALRISIYCQMLHLLLNPDLSD